MAYSPRIVANAFLWEAQKRGAALTHMKVQKLVFFMHAWYLAKLDKPLVSELPEAWEYGPVFSSIYHELKAFGSSAIGALMKEMNPATGQFVALVPSPEDKTFWAMLEKVWDRYSRFTAGQLSSLSHEKGGPWDTTPKGRDIPNELIAEYYRHKLAAAQP